MNEEESGVAQYFFLFQLEMFNRPDSYTTFGTADNERLVKLMVE
jgi:hypothetical protein